MPDHRYLVPGYREGARAWLQRRASCLTKDALYLATEKGITPGYREVARAWLQRRASRLITEKSFVPDQKVGGNSLNCPFSIDCIEIQKGNNCTRGPMRVSQNRPQNVMLKTTKRGWDLKLPFWVGGWAGVLKLPL